MKESLFLLNAAVNFISNVEASNKIKIIVNIIRRVFVKTSRRAFNIDAARPIAHPASITSLSEKSDSKRGKKPE